MFLSFQIEKKTEMFDRRRSATARVFSNSRDVMSDPDPATSAGATAYIAQAYSDYSDPVDAIPPGGSAVRSNILRSDVIRDDVLRDDVTTAHAYGGVRRSASSAAADSRVKSPPKIRDLNLSHRKASNKQVADGYTRVHPDARKIQGGECEDALETTEQFRQTRHYGHGVFVARSLSDAGSIPHAPVGSAHPDAERNSRTSPDGNFILQQRRNSVSDSVQHYEDLDALRALRRKPEAESKPTSAGKTGGPVKRSSSDVSRLSHFSPPNKPEDIYTHPDKSLKRASSQRESGLQQRSLPRRPGDQTPESPPAPPLPPPPPLSPASPGPTPVIEASVLGRRAGSPVARESNHAASPKHHNTMLVCRAILNLII